MPFDDTGFTPKSPEDLVKEYEEAAINLFDIVNHSPGSILWQIMKIHAVDRYEYETMLETAADMMSITDAEGIFLDKHGLECMLPRRDAVKSEGYVDVKGYINPDSPVPIIILADAVFSSSRNKYISDDDNEIPHEISMIKTRTGESRDYFPSTVVSADNVKEIRDEDNQLISDEYYEFDETYYNNIHWLESSSAVIVANEPYTIKVTGYVTAKVEVTSENVGADTIAAIDEVTISETYGTLTVTNSTAIDGGADKETNEKYRSRLLTAKRRDFTLGRVRNMAEEIQGVRSAKVWQDKGVDQHSVAIWPSGMSGERDIKTTYPKTSQAFVPGNLVLSLGRVIMYGRAVNDPPDLLCGLRFDISPTGAYFAKGRIPESNLDPSITGMQDLYFDMKFNGLDLTKTYHLDIWLDNPTDTGLDLDQNYWKIALTDEQYRADNRGELFYLNGSWVGQGNNVDLMFKTLYNGAAYTIMLAPADGYGFEGLKETLDKTLDYVDGGGYSPVGIQYVINEAEEIFIDIRCYIYTTPLANFVTVRDVVIDNIETYLEGLTAGDNVVYSRIEYEIMKHPNVWKQTNLEIKRKDTLDWVQKDIYIAEAEIADLGTRNIQLGYEIV